MALAEARGDERGERERGRDRADPQRPLEAAAQPAGLLAAGCRGRRARAAPSRGSARPPGVKPSNWRPRRTSGTPSSRSRLRMPAESVGCAAWQAAAARPKWRSRSSATRYSSCRMNTARSYFDRWRLSTGRLAAVGQVRPTRRRFARTCRATWSSWSAATTSRERRPRSTCSKRRWIERGEITDDDRRVAAERSGPARGGRPRRLDLLRRPARPARRAPRARLHRDGVLRRHRRRARRRARATRSGLELGERARGPVASRSAETVCLGYCHASPGGARRRRDRRRPGRGRARARAARRSPRREPLVASLLDEPVLTRAGRLVRAAARAERATPEELLEAVKAADVRGRGGAGFPAGTKWEFAAQAPRASASSSSPTATRATRAPTSTRS